MQGNVDSWLLYAAGMNPVTQDPTPSRSREAGLRLAAFTQPRVRQADIAREAGVPRSYICAIVAGRRPPSIKVLGACERLGLPVDQIVGEDNLGRS
jgi:transcriptional regulator with XRE-family HTH domain